jgi:hypothetical protein
MARAYRTQHVAEAPRGWRVRSKREGEHVIRIAFPPGPRKRGAGRLLEILHPKKNPACEDGSCDVSQKNPSELLIFGNPAKKKNASGGIGNHKPGCPCAFCVKARALAAGQNPRRKKSAKAASGRTAKSKAAALPARRRRTRNPEMAGTQQAVRLFETFHGRDAQEVVEKQVSAAMRMDYTALGDLVALGLGECSKHGNALVNGWDECNNLLFEGDGVKLASSPEGRQLYLIGGNQNLDKALSSWEGIDPEKDLIDLGECGFVVYEARKAHSNFEPVEWVHEFGEGGNTVPRILYDRLKRQVFLSGGEYFIDASKELSPGIEG